MQRGSAMHEAWSKYKTEQWRTQPNVDGFHVHCGARMQSCEFWIVKQRTRHWIDFASHSHVGSALQVSGEVRNSHFSLQIPVIASTTQSSRAEQSRTYGH